MTVRRRVELRSQLALDFKSSAVACLHVSPHATARIRTGESSCEDASVAERCPTRLGVRGTTRSTDSRRPNAKYRRLVWGVLRGNPGMPHRLRQVADPSGVLYYSQFDDCSSSIEVDVDIRCRSRCCLDEHPQRSRIVRIQLRSDCPEGNRTPDLGLQRPASLASGDSRAAQCRS